MSFPDPYRKLFPLGAVIGAAGAGLWLLFSMQWISVFPRVAHGNIMFFGLMWSFVAGFLMTAIPKMTGTISSNQFEFTLALILPVLQVAVGLLNFHDASVALFAMQILFLVFFIVRRFLINKSIPFFGFIFLPAAFIQALAGCILYFSLKSGDRNVVILLCGEAFLMNLILGLGSRLVPVVSRLPNALLPTEKSKVELWGMPVAVLLTMNLSYWVQIFVSQEMGLVLRILGVSLGAIFLLKLFSKPTQWTTIGISLKAGILFVIAGQVLPFVDPQTSLAALHLTYIGGFVLITILVSTRVMLAHGGQALSYEVGSRRLMAISSFIALSALLRFLAGNNFLSPLITLSIILLFISFGLWLHKFIGVSLTPNNKGG